VVDIDAPVPLDRAARVAGPEQFDGVSVRFSTPHSKPAQARTPMTSMNSSAFCCVTRVTWRVRFGAMSIRPSTDSWATVPAGARSGHAWRVAAAVPIIDLDVTPPRLDVEPRSLRSRLATARPVLIGGVFVLVLALLGAATGPARRMTPVLSAGGTAAAAFVLGPDSLYTAHFGLNPNSESGVRGFSLTDGSLRWAAAVPQNVQNLVLDASAHVLMGRSGTDPKIIFLDADTGTVLWRSAEANTSVVAIGLGGVLMRTDVSNTETALRLADARTGRLIWTRTVDPTAELGPDALYGDAPSRIVAVGSTGKVIVLNYADGSVLGEGDLHVRLPGDADPLLPADFAAVSLVGDRLLLSRREGGHASLTAYATVPFGRQWEVEGGPVGRVVDCVAVLCVADGRGVSGVDPGTGARRWTQPGWAAAVRYDSSHLFAYDRQETPVSALLDPATGRVVRRLGHALLVGALLLRRVDADVAGRTWVVEVHRSDGTTHPVGTLDSAAPYGCSVRTSYLACPTAAGPTSVWRAP
jgi:outer membrane protein assembly factor BamB